ncbi:uncharacterized protein [Dermacentor andersoni]|uniref:uncharacterized protein n=1 Tax=Dermacentor andersoni TaxID=34620 RepID=UPI003B3B0F0B
MASMSRATAYRRVSQAVQADVRAILAAADEHINAGNLPGVAATSFQPVEVREPPPNLSLGQVASGGICGGAQEFCDVDQSGDSIHSNHSFPVELDNVLGRRHRSVTEQDTVADSTSTSTLFKELDIASLKEDLRQWSLQSSVPHDVITNLLKVLRSYSCLRELPNSARALLSTPRVANVTLMDSGQYCHFGLCEGLHSALTHVVHVPDPIVIHVNVDGLPLTKSTRGQFWPILCRVSNCKPSEPFPVGVFFGECKPSQANVYLQPFVRDLKSVLQEGLTLGSKNFAVQVGALICDAPAKSYVLGIKGHNGYFSCSKCVTEGDFEQGRMCFPEVDAPLRTNNSFRTAEQEEHHTMKTILLELPIDIIKHVPLDYMHLICLGVVRKLLLLWIKGEKKYRIGKDSRDAVSGANSEMKHFVPSELSRKPRSLSELDKWKATEFRTFLLYTGPVVLMSHIAQCLMDNFITLHCAVSLLCSPQHCSQHLEYSRKLLGHFVEVYITLFGKHAVSHNIHGLIHVADDVNTYGPLDNYSAFPFENYMCRLKKYVRKPERPLEQLHNRILEERSFNKPSPSSSAQPPSSWDVIFIGTERAKLKGRHEEGPLPPGCVGPQYKALEVDSVTFKPGKRDSTSMLDDGTIVKMENIAHSDDRQPVIIGRKYEKLEDLYLYPCSSSLLNVHLASQASGLQFWPISKIKTKCVRLPVGKKFAVFPFVHQK